MPVPKQVKTTGIPPGGFAPVDNYAAPLIGTSAGVFNALSGYTRPLQAQTGPVDASTTAQPGLHLPNNDDNGIALDSAHFPPKNLYYGALNRQKTLEHFDILPVPISGPSTEVVRPIQQANYTLPSPRWTAHAAGPVFRYTREFAQRFENDQVPGFLVNSGAHMSMAQSYGANKWIQSKTARTMARNNITPRNVPTPLDDQVVNTANNSRFGSVFSSYRETTFMP